MVGMVVSGGFGAGIGSQHRTQVVLLQLFGGADRAQLNRLQHGIQGHDIG
jgi:hypothetical protein